MQTHILGFPSMGKRRELKQALEAFWKGAIPSESLLATATQLKRRHWQVQEEAGLSFVATGDFSLYDRMLDITCMLGALPRRFAPCAGYFALARGDTRRDIAPLEMTKWFDTNYHYLVPEIDADGAWTPGTHPVLADTALARDLGFSPKPAIVGPFTWLALAKAAPGVDKWQRLDGILSVYEDLLAKLAPLCDLVQLEEPVLCTDLLPPQARRLFADACGRLSRACGGKILLATYFGTLADNLDLAVSSGCAALHVDLVRAGAEFERILDALPSSMALSLGVVDGRNIWKTDLAWAAGLARRAVEALGSGRVLLASSCSLLHCPVDLDEEKSLPAHIRARMAFAVQKCGELATLRRIVEEGDEDALAAEARARKEAEGHPEACIPAVRERMAAVTPRDLRRVSPYAQRRKAQAWLDLPLLPTTTIGSFPQTAAIRGLRRDRRKGLITEEQYVAAIRSEIAGCIHRQEELGLDVLVHGEAERNDMVEYFGEQLGGFCFTENGWVQSYGSRCVKPPVIYGDVWRRKPMTVDWILHAQSLTEKPVKGMLTGPVTMLCWSFVRDDLPRSEVCRQLALALRDEVQDLEKAGVRIIQIDEAALREGMPLHRQEAEGYLQWAVDAFRLASSGVADSTQIHSHMCYSEFNAILPWIAKMDADVISIESSRSRMELLDAFTRFDYRAAVGPGVYDIHSPRIPGEDEIVGLIRKALEHIPADRLWINPDCGLKTRRWEEAYPSLRNMVAAAKRVRATLAATDHGK